MTDVFEMALPWRRMRIPSRALIAALGVATFVKLAWMTSVFDSSSHPAVRTSSSATAAVLLLLAAPLPSLSPAFRVAAALVLDMLLSSIVFVDRVHWRFGGDVTSLSELSHLWQLWTVRSSVIAALRPGDLLLFADVIVIGFIVWRFKVTSPASGQSWRRLAWQSSAIVAMSLLLVVPTARLIAHDPDEVFEYSTTRREVAVAIGIIPYHLYDLFIQVAFPWSGRATTTETERGDALRLLAAIGRSVSPSPLHGAAHGRDVVLIMCEALQHFPIGLTFNDQPITPNLSAFAAESLHFVNTYDQTYMGTTSDGEFTSLQSLHPLPTGAVATRYGANDFFALPAILASHGYETLSAVAESGDFWNKRQMHPKLGFRQSFFADAFRPGELLGLGLADREFFAQIDPVLRSQPRPFMALLITLSNHHPYRLPAGHRVLPLGELAGSLLGDYLESVHYFDTVFGGLVDTLRRDGVLDRSLIVLYGDHQAFWEDIPELRTLLRMAHDDVLSMWQARKRVALMIRLPDGAHASAQAHAAGQLDIAPTVLGLLGIDRRGEAMMGRDLTGNDDPLDVLRDGSFVTDKVISIEQGEAGGCYTLPTGIAVDCDSFADVRERAVRRLKVSDSIVRGNLVPWLRSSLRNYDVSPTSP